MHPQYRCPVKGGNLVCTVIVSTGKALVCGTNQYRMTRHIKFFQPFENLPALRGALGKAKAGVEHPFLYAFGSCTLAEMLEITLEFLNDIVPVSAQRVHRAGIAPLVHCDVWQFELTYKRQHPRIVLACGDVVYDKLPYRLITAPDNL